MEAEGVDIRTAYRKTESTQKFANILPNHTRNAVMQYKLQRPAPSALIRDVLTPAGQLCLCFDDTLSPPPVSDAIFWLIFSCLLAEGEARAYRKFAEWDRRRKEAEDRGEEFTEPPPTQPQEQITRETKRIILLQMSRQSNWRLSLFKGRDIMEKSALAAPTRDIELYGRFLGKLSIVIAHRYIMKPSGEEITHWTNWIYGLGDHMYHFCHSITGIVIQIVLFGLLFRVSWKIVRSWFPQQDQE